MERIITKQRASIACLRCRKSKIKCVNQGVGFICEACSATGRGCQYVQRGVRFEPTANVKRVDDERMERIRKHEDRGKGNSTLGEDPLESSVLTKKVWDEVYNIFKMHFSTEMPFLHPPTFRNRMRQASYPRDISTDLQESRVLLLAVLTLTARFHPELVSSHSQANNPIDVSEYYATALKTALGPTGSSPSIDCVQARLMLGLYEWGQTRCLSAWVSVGIAIRLAQSMKLAYEDDDDNPTFKHSASQKQDANVRERAIEKEVRRRTLWSCFIMDRMLSAGKYRQIMISVNQLKVLLPCSDDQFLFVHDVRTSFLDKLAQPNENVDDGDLGFYIRLNEIFGRLSQWSCAGGRRIETMPPWNNDSQFFQLRQELDNFYQSLPPNLTFTEANLSAHIEMRKAAIYSSIHALYLLCLIILHREYIPFIPLGCKKPRGPLDEPIFSENEYRIPNGFWGESAKTIFKSAIDIVVIFRTCQENNALPESPRTGFALWQAAFVCLYAVHFPHMDVGGYLHLGSNQNNDDYRIRYYADLAVRLLEGILPRLKMVKGYLETLGKMHEYFSNVKTEYQQRSRQIWPTGGGLEEYKTFEKELKEFGSLHDTDKNAPSDGSDTVDQAASRASTNDIGQGSIKGDAIKVIEAVPPPIHGATVNSTSNLLYAQSQSYLNPGQQQHLPVNAFVPQHILPMAPPNTQGELQPRPQEESMVRQDGINTNADYDDMAQEDFGQYDGLPHSVNNQTCAYNFNLWNVDGMVGNEQTEFY